MSTTNVYEVVFEPFSERHFMKAFSKKYKGAWDVTRMYLAEEFRFFDALSGKHISETIVDSKEVKICKTEFKISGTQQSRHGSGNRCIVAVHKETRKVHILLVYSKTDLRGHNETAEWKSLIRENYPEYRELCK